MSAFKSVCKRELRAFFASPLAYVFIGVYLLLSGLATWNIARFFDTARVDLDPLFQFQPWFLAILAPAIGMRLWSEDLKSRSSDIYFTAPVPLIKIHLAKAVAGLTVLIAALAATLPYWIVVSYLGAPDHGLIALNYLHLILISALFLIISMTFSAVTRQQVVALVLGVTVNLILLVAGLNIVTDIAGNLPARLLTGWLDSFGLFSLLTNAQRGVLRLSDPLIYLSLMALFCSAGVTLLDARRRPGHPVWRSWTGATLAILFLGFPAVRATLDLTIGQVRIDVTGYQLNTLSHGARALAASVEEPIDLTLFYSEDIGAEYPNIRAHADRVEALLNAFAVASNGNIRTQTINPSPFSSGEDLAITQGISAVPTEGIDPLYFGLSGRNLVDDQKAIPFLAPEQDHRLEFEVARMISQLDSVTRSRLGILSDIPALDGAITGNQRSAIQRAIEDQYQVSWLTGDMYSLPDGLEAIIIAQPEHLSTYTLYLLDQYLLSGGNLIVLADPEPVMHQTRQIAEPLRNWMAGWGLTLTSDIVADESLGLPVTVQSASGNRTVSQPIFPAPGPSLFDREDFLTANLRQPINFGAAGYLVFDYSDAVSFSPLVSTSDTPALISADARRNVSLTPTTARNVMSPHEGAITLAARLSGSFPLFFTAAPQPGLPDDPVLARLAASEVNSNTGIISQGQQANILFIPDTDILFDAFYINPQDGTTIADNRAFLMTAIDQFAGNPELARLRARPPAIRQMTRVTELRNEAETLYLAEQTAIEDRLFELEAEIESADEASNVRLQTEYLEAREALRDLQRQFRQRIDGLEAWLRWWTIWFPALLAFLLSATIRLLVRRFAR